MGMWLINRNNIDERRVQQRRVCLDRRAVVRFGDALGRRSGFERRRGFSLARIKGSLKVWLNGNCLR